MHRLYHLFIRLALLSGAHVLSLSPAYAQTTPSAATASASNLPNFVLYQIKTGDTLLSLAETFLGGANFAPELLSYNDISNPADLVPGLVIAIPRAIRDTAIAEFVNAEAWLIKASDAQAKTYASNEYAQAEQELAKARDARNRTVYDKTIALSRVAQIKAQRAWEAANANVWKQRTAIISSIHQSVEYSTNRVEWFEAKLNQAVGTNVVIKTGNHSRAELTFPHDGSVVQVLEDTEMRVSTCLENVRDKTRNTRLQVIMGNIIGEIKPRKPEDEKTRFDIDAGKTAIAIRGTSLRVGADAESTTRVSLLETAKDIIVAADAREVSLVSNQGTLAKKGEAPRPPVTLPSAPPLLTPAPGNPVIAALTPTLTWQAVVADPQPAKYHVELASDEKFNQVIEHALIPGTELTARLLPEGLYHWRVSSVDKNGLEGKPSEARSFSVRKNLLFNFQRDPAELLVGNQEYFRPGYRVFAAPVDPENTSIARLEYSRDGDLYSPFTNPVLFASTAEHSLFVRGIASDGSQSEVQKLSFHVDGVGPAITEQITFEGDADALTHVAIVALSATDPVGVKQIEYSSDGKIFLPYTAPVTFRLLTDQLIRYRATDLLGNTSAIQSISLKGIPVKK